MRHNRGRRWPRNRSSSYSNPQISQINKSNINTFGNSIPRTNNTQNYTYIGRCRCGFGPNAYYKTRDGKVIHVNQINQSSRIYNNPPKSIVSQKPPRKTLTTPIKIDRICNKCGAKVRDDAYFCTECGNELMSSPITSKKEQIDFLKDKIKDLKNQIKILKKYDL